MPKEIPHLIYADAKSSAAVDLMEHLLKHLYGWLAESGVFLSKEEFKLQAMKPSVVQNFLLFPMQRYWKEFEKTLARVRSSDLDFLKGFIKK